MVFIIPLLSIILAFLSAVASAHPRVDTQPLLELLKRGEKEEIDLTFGVTGAQISFAKSVFNFERRASLYTADEGDANLLSVRLQLKVFDASLTYKNSPRILRYPSTRCRCTLMS